MIAKIKVALIKKIKNNVNIMKRKNLIVKILVIIAYFAMIGVNYLANALPIGGVNTGEASDMYPNLFTPAGVTFSIWGLIYTLLLGYTIYQFGFLQKKRDEKKEEELCKINRYFLLSSVANISWIFAWHYGIIWLSLLIMFVLLFSLIKIADVINLKGRNYNLKERFFIRLPFSIYFGWITVATVANISVFLVSLNWNGFGISEVIWTIIVLLVAAAIGLIRAFKDSNICYALVLVWAYSGILYKHYSVGGYDQKYPMIMITLLICLFLFLGGIGYLASKKTSKKLKK